MSAVLTGYINKRTPRECQFSQFDLCRPTIHPSPHALLKTKSAFLRYSIARSRLKFKKIARFLYMVQVVGQKCMQCFFLANFRTVATKKNWKILEPSVFLVRKSFKNTKFRKKTLVEACSKYFTFIFSLLVNLAKTSLGSSPLWLHHKVKTATNPISKHCSS